jgi:hypothetical protein
MRRTDIEATDKRLGIIEGLVPLKTMRRSDCPTKKKDAVRRGDTMKATIARLAPAPLRWIV